MKKLFILLMATALLPGISVLKARAQATVSGQAFAEVISALTATETSQLNFGRFSPEVQGGEVVVSPDGSRSAKGSVILSGGVANASIFYITGAPEASFSIQLPKEPAVLTHQNSTKTMVVTNWVSSPLPGSTAGILINGQQYVHLGASLIVGSLIDNPVGLYSGVFSLTFAYN